jgi:predicted SAM-dependent methyltransferase
MAPSQDVALGEAGAVLERQIALGRPQATGMRQLLRRSQFLVALAKAIRALRGDLQVLAGSTVRGRAIRRYLAGTHTRKLHLGTSYSVLSGWLNTDVIPVSKGVIYLDATRPFPFADNTFDYVFSEHMIEHIDHESGLLMLAECHRVLKPGGKVRIATPDIEILMGLHTRQKDAMQRRYIQWIADHCLSGIQDRDDVFVINNGFRNWGHAFLYDRDTLTASMSRQGFANLTIYKPGISEDPHLKGLESHGKTIQAEDLNQYETLIVEGECLKASA